MIAITTANADDDAWRRRVHGGGLIILRLRRVILRLWRVTAAVIPGAAVALLAAVAILAAVDAAGEAEGEYCGEKDFFHDGKFLRHQRGIITAPV